MEGAFFLFVVMTVLGSLLDGYMDVLDHTKRNHSPKDVVMD